MTAGEIELVCKAHGIAMVDGALQGQARRLADHATLFLSGGEAEQVADLFGGLLQTRVVGDEVGRASMLKMLMGGISKGITVLFLEMGRAASEAQMLDEFWQSIVHFYPGFTTAVERMLPTVPRHGTRRAGEMGELADTLASLALSPGLALEFQRVFAEAGRAALPASVSPHELSVPELLDQLAQAMRHASRDLDAEFNQHFISTTPGS
jgi:3-hydroxyisobutyrate dehydrogenase-like beta-hydroxyacid dehydrogenase